MAASRTMERPAPAASRGFTMLEILISILIIVLGLLGLAGMQAVAQQAELESYQRAQALVLLSDMVDSINGNRGSAGCFAFTTQSDGTPYAGTTTGGGYLGTANCGTGFLNSQTKAMVDGLVTTWDQHLQGSAETASGGAAIGAMIGARGCVSYDSTTQIYTVIVTWQGMTDTFAPVKNCANGKYGAETKRRAVWTTIQIANLSG